MPLFANFVVALRAAATNSAMVTDLPAKGARSAGVGYSFGAAATTLLGKP
ncbi:hypothetical protein J7E70_25830 [Variovorax paradoxus]|nr:hypothetical protein [Variovorax paradoxus]MBT2303869.1 hypothetical protein [Variovorax paradoxus]